MIVSDTIHHGDYFHERRVTLEPTLEAFLALLNSGPYGGGRAVTENNQTAVAAWHELTNTGRTGFGWRTIAAVV